MARGRGVAVALVAAFGVLILLWGSGSGTSLIGPPQGTAGLPLAPPDGGLTVNTAAPTFEALQPLEEDPVNVPWEAILIGLVLLAVMIRLVRWLLDRDWEAPEVDVHEEPDEVSLLIEATSAERRDWALAHGDPRNAVVACWVALEDAAERGGVRRRPAETSAEFTARVLDAWNVPPDVVAALAELYREARFSRHPVTEQMRTGAVQALAQINSVLRGRVDA